MHDERQAEATKTPAPVRTARIGRPRKLTPRVEKRILDAIRAGHPRSSAAAAAGIGSATLYRYLAADDARARRFQQRVEEAEAELEAALLKPIMARVPDDPRLALAVLVRRFPRRWGTSRESEPPSVAEQATVMPSPMNVVVVDPGLIEQIAQQRLEEARRAQGTASVDLRALRVDHTGDRDEGAWR